MPASTATRRGNRFWPISKLSSCWRAVRDHIISIGKCDRCKTVVEPLLSTQWFIRIQPLADKAIAAVEQGHIRFTPEQYAKTYFEWMRNIHDWCISRQLWWGHRIPAWHCAPMP